MENSFKREGPYYSMTVKINAKGESSGEYSVKADTYEELTARNDETRALLLRTIM